MSDEDVEKLRDKVTEKLASGLETKAFPRAYDSEEFEKITAQLRTLGDDDWVEKLVIAGFTDHTIETDDIEQPCETCMYYLTRKKICDIPEIMLPAEPHWSCRLWRI